MSQTSEEIAVSAIGNTIPQPPRLSGNATDDLQAMQAWVGDLHRILAREINVVGTQRLLIATLNALLVRVAALEARVDADASLFDTLAFMPGTVSGTYVGSELAAVYTKINQMIAILRNP